MDVYRTEEEQIEAIKRYVAEYGTKIILAFVACIALFFGYQSWEQKQLASKHTVSMYYNELNETLGSGQGLTDEDRARFDAVFAKLLGEYPKSIYASYASLHKAKLDVEKSDLDKAVQSLQWVVDAAVNAEIIALANLRLARVEFARGNIDKGLALLQNNAGPFAAEYQEAKGDMLLEKNQPEKALIAYKKAQGLITESGAYSNRILDMKVETLNTADHSKLFPSSKSKSAEVTSTEVISIEDSSSDEVK